MSDNNIAVGIDFGTTNSVISYWDKGRAVMVTDPKGNRMMPSIVAFNKKGRMTGHDAKNQMSSNPENSIYEVKRLVGRYYDDQEVQDCLSYFTYKLSKGEKNEIIINTKYQKKAYTTQEISSFILAKLKNITTKYFKEDVKDAVVTVPAYFNEIQRQAVKDAAIIAGFNCLRIINEPTAAALAYGVDTTSSKEKNILVYDLGGGTLDISVLNIDEGVFKVIATNGDPFLGGSDFDDCILNNILNKFKLTVKGFNLRYCKKNIRKLRTACELAKITLSNQDSALIYLESFYIDKKNDVKHDLKFNLTKAEFEALAKKLFTRASKPLNDILKLANMNKEDIDDILLVGGSTKIPKIQQILNTFFGKQPILAVNPDYAVATGAAIQAHMLTHTDDLDIILIDVVPLSLGIETHDGLMAKLIDRNTTIPTKKTKQFTTEKDDQTEVIIKIFEGERRMCSDNAYIGTFTLSDIDPAPKGYPVIFVTVNIDVNGIINVIATEKKNKNTSNLTIVNNSAKLSKEEIERLVQEAKANEVEDNMKQEFIELEYEMLDLIRIIDVNARSDDSNLEDDKIDEIAEDLCTFKDLLEQEYPSIVHHNKLFKKKIKTLKDRYTPFLIKNINPDDEIKSHNISKDKDNFDNIDSSEDEISDDSDLEVIDEINEDDCEEKEQLADMCINTLEEMKDFGFNEHIEEKLFNYINDCILWLNVTKVTKSNKMNIYKNKIREFEEKLEKLEEENRYTNIEVRIKAFIEKNKNIILKKDNDDTYKNNLISLCGNLKLAIINNCISMEGRYLEVLGKRVNECILWLLSLDDTPTEDSDESNVDKYEDNDLVFYNKMEEINKLCESLSQKNAQTDQ